MYPKHLGIRQGISHFTEEICFSKVPFNWIKGFVEKNYNFGMHTQNFYEVNVILKGKGVHYIESNCIEVEKRDVFVIPPNCSHGYYNVEELDVYHLLISQSFMEQYGEELQSLPCFFSLFNTEPYIRMNGSLQLHLKMNHEDFLKINPILKQIAFRMEKNTPVYTQIRNAAALIAIAHFCDSYEKQYAVWEVSSDSHQYTYFMDSISVIYKGFYQKLTIEDLSKVAHMSRSSYIKLFKKIMSDSPGRFLLLYRLKKAKQFLSNTDLSIDAIAQQTGFFDVSHFNRYFKQTEGCSPTCYRSTHKT